LPGIRAGETVLRIRYTLDWHEPRRLHKVHLPTRYTGRDALYGAPFGSTARPQMPTGPLGDAMWEVPASRWAAVTTENARQGLFLVTEAKYGFACRKGELQLSLVRSPKSGEGYTDLGQHTIEIALGQFSATAPREEQPFALDAAIPYGPFALLGLLVEF